MVKVTIYLPDELHQAIKHAARERGATEAELIRTAIRHELGASADPRYALVDVIVCSLRRQARQFCLSR